MQLSLSEYDLLGMCCRVVLTSGTVFRTISYPKPPSLSMFPFNLNLWHGLCPVPRKGDMHIAVSWSPGNFSCNCLPQYSDDVLFCVPRGRLLKFIKATRSTWRWHSIMHLLHQMRFSSTEAAGLAGRASWWAGL